MATYRDRQLQCASCGRTFFFTVTDQRRLDQEGKEMKPPAVCPTCRQVDPSTGKHRGTVKWFKPEKGYGFVRTADGEEFFFHRTRTLEADPSRFTEGAEVLFEVETTPKGREATQVELARASEEKAPPPEDEAPHSAD